MRDACLKIWTELEDDSRKKTIDTFRECCRQVVKNKGGKIAF